MRASELKSAGHSCESLQRVDADFKRNSQLVSGNKSCHGVFGVVATWHGQLQGGPFSAFAINAASIVLPFKSEVGIGMLSVGDDPFKNRGKLSFCFFDSLAEVSLKFFDDAAVHYFRP